MNLLDIGSVVEGVGKVADDLFTSDEERLKISIEEKTLALQEKTIEADLIKGQMDINKTEAQHASIFVAGWRPMIGWIGALALAYQFILYPLLVWGWSLLKASAWIPVNLEVPPVLPADQLWVILTGMLGIAGMRSFDKLKGTDTGQVGPAKK